jgi:hypothetical protein
MHMHGNKIVEAPGAAAAQSTGRIEQYTGVASAAVGNQQRPPTPLPARRGFLRRLCSEMFGYRRAEGVEQPTLDRISLRGSFP